ncbi:uncharacterized protein [Maniola hyperantus]|uniref:uncharacterized protein n=1 Tax=Aphantopus hyperantus TaxID=2795564 RepID=UPI00213E4150
MRSAAYPMAEAEAIANSIGAPPPPRFAEVQPILPANAVDTTCAANLPANDSSRASSPVIFNTPDSSVSGEPSTTSLSTMVSGDAPAEPAERSKVTYIPARAVNVRYVSFQTNTPVTPPMSATCQQIIALMANTEKSASQPLINTVRSPLARDMASTQMLISFMSASNGSHIDTAPAVRGICYAAAHCTDMYDMDRSTNHFLRREVLTTPSTRVFRVHNRPVASQHPVNIIAVTLPAFTNHLKNHDTLLGAAGWGTECLDQTWTAIPITSDMMTAPWLKEYILCFVDTAVWAGRVSYSTSTTHLNAAGQAHRTNFTHIPNSHNVSIPGPQQA